MEKGTEDEVRLTPAVVLSAERLTKRFGDLVAVSDLSLEVHAGEVFGFLGPNGAGKTTSINMMCGLTRPDQGRVFLHGQLITDRDPDLRARVGVCPQHLVLWTMLTCLEQMVFMGEMYGVPRRLARLRSRDLLAALGLSEKTNKPARTLSGGMQRRLNLALALVHDPELLVLDEPEAGLDPQSRVMVRDYIKSLARKKTVILTTHNMDEAERLADRVAIIDRGKLLVLDTPENLKRSVGEGDVLEIEVLGAEGQVEKAVAAVQPVAEATARGTSVVIQARAVVEKLPAILEALRSAGVKPGEVRLRENTLEDVFIALTGRRLRQ